MLFAHACVAHYNYANTQTHAHTHILTDKQACSVFFAQALGGRLKDMDRKRIRALKVCTVRKFVDKRGLKRCTGFKTVLKATQRHT